MNYIDIIITAYMGFGFFRGRKRGLAGELFRLLNVAIAFLGSLGLFKFVRSLLTNVLGLDSGIAGVLGFVVIFIGIMMLLRKMRKKIRGALEDKFSNDESKNVIGGGVIGLVRAGFIALSILTVLVLSKMEWVQSIAEHSFVGKALNALLG